MKTKQQKIKEVKKGNELTDKSKSLVFVDFTKTSTKNIDELKKLLETEKKGIYKVLKKRLLNLVLKEKNIPIDAKQFSSQVAAIFSEKEVSDPAGIIYRFFKSKEKELPEFKMLAGYDFATTKSFDQDEIKRIGQLPPREILLAQLLGMINAPLRSLAYALDQISKKSQTNN